VKKEKNKETSNGQMIRVREQVEMMDYTCSIVSREILNTSIFTTHFDVICARRAFHFSKNEWFNPV
jgi:hypothetical protein